MQGGERIARVLAAQGVEQLFTLCGGHISPILVQAKRLGIRVVDVRHEVNAVFAADAVARLTGKIGVAAVTAGPGVTNTLTAVKNAQLAQSPVLILGGATATVLRKRGALQDIDQIALLAPHVKWATRVDRLRQLVPTVEQAIEVALSGVPGPVFVECPVDLLYDESTVRDMYGAKTTTTWRSVGDLALQGYLHMHLKRVFLGSKVPLFSGPVRPQIPGATSSELEMVRRALEGAQRPILVLGSQATLQAREVEPLTRAIDRLGVPTYLSGMARGLLGREHPLWLRHKRGQALREADLVILAGLPCDFRLDYGRQIGRDTILVSINRSERDLKLNRRPDLGIQADPGRALRALADRSGSADRDQRWENWLATLRERNDARVAEIESQAQAAPEGGLNPVAVVSAVEQALDDDSTIVADGGDFVGTASYVVSARGPLRWLDPGVFGTLGVGAGFAMGAKLVSPDSEVWILYGDGSLGYTLAEFDTFARLGIAVIAVVGNDACWSQIAREQEELLGDPVGTVLARTDYHKAAEALGGKGLCVTQPQDLAPRLAEAKRLAAEGHAVLVNVHLARSDFRKGSISM